MKVIGYTALHYGRDYLAYAIRSVIDHLDAYYVLYTAKGSHGHRTDIPCPETRDELHAIALQAAGDKLVWIDGEWDNEGQQRDSIHLLAPDADVVVVLDADEVWAEGMVESVINLPEKTYWYPKRLRVPIIHYWRSFHHVVLHDPAFPIRAIYPQKALDETAVYNLPDARSINHFGYAQRPEIVQYKLLTHGHKNEFRRDVDWFTEKFLANAQVDTHPVGSEYWNPERVDPLDYLPRWMIEHPYFQKSVIV